MTSLLLSSENVSRGYSRSAEAEYRKVLEKNPDHFGSLYNLGLLLSKKEGGKEEALGHFRKALVVRPEAPDVLSEILKILISLGPSEEEREHMQNYLPVLSKNMEALFRLGDLLHTKGRGREAIALYRQCLDMEPDRVEVLNNLGTVLSDEGEYEEGLACWNRAVSLDPDCFMAKVNRSLALLLLGRYEEGWSEFRARHFFEGYKGLFSVMGTLWNGEPLQGKTILLLPEQGDGDVIQFVRYARLFKEKGAKVVLSSLTRLKRLLASVPGVDSVVDSISVFPDHDYHFFLLDAPFFFGARPEEFPKCIPYIFPDVSLQKKWEERLAAVPGRKIGLVWAGNPKYRKDSSRSIDPALLTALLQIPGCSFISLQKPSMPQKSLAPLIDWTTELTDFAETAALISHLECVITVDTAVAHLAGAVGKPVWILLPKIPDWRWMLDRSDSPWYPTARLFRQKEQGDWLPVVEDVREALTQETDVFSVSEFLQTTKRLYRSFMEEVCEVGCRKLLNESSAHREILHTLVHRDPSEDLSYLAEDLDILTGVGELLVQNLWFEEAITVDRQRLAVDPNRVRALLSLGIVLGEVGRREEGLRYMNKAVALDPNCSDARCCRGFLLLLQGRYREGWSEFRLYRQVTRDPKFSGLKGRSWNGEDVRGKTILLFVDQGFGDTIQFIRYAPLFKKRGAEKVIVACYGTLMRLLSLVEGVDAVVGVTTVSSPNDWQIGAGFGPPDHDFHFFLMDAPAFFGELPEDFPVKIPYVLPEERLQERWRKRISDLPGRKIGLVWAGSEINSKDALRSIDTTILEELLQTPGCSFVSLQKGKKGHFSSPRLADWTEELFDFADTAALISLLDCVISVDTAVAHLAGAMGKPVWVLLPYVPDWRWLLDRSDNPWYPTARLFRQKNLREWKPVLREVREALISHVNNFSVDRFLQTVERLHQSFSAGSGGVIFRRVLEKNGHYRKLLDKLVLSKRSEVNDLSRLAEDVESLCAVGELLRLNHCSEEAIVIYKHILSVKPDQADVVGYLGLALTDSGKQEEGLFHLNRSLEMDPNCLSSRYGRGLLLCSLGRYEEGWSEYRNACKSFFYPQGSGIESPVWNGEDLTGKTLLLLSEQGAGDTLQFVRYASLFREKGAVVLLSCAEPLVRLLLRVEGPHIVIASESSMPHHDFQFFLMDAPCVFGAFPKEITSKIPYIVPKLSLGEKWKERMSKLPGLKVGVAWAGNPEQEKDVLRSIDPLLLTDLLQMPGCSFVSLQKGKKGSFSTPFLTDWTEELSDFADTASLISHLDYVITVDTSVAHLAGAMGKPVGILLSYVPDWRWMFERSDSPWYPTATLFRQKKSGDWQSVLVEVKQALSEKIFNAPDFSFSSKLLQSSDNPVYRKVLESSPFHRDILNQLLSSTGHKEKLIEFSKNGEALRAVGELLQTVYANEEAVVAYRQSLSIDPSHPGTLANLGRALVDTGEYEEGLSCLEKAVRSDAGCLEAKFGRACLLLLLGRHHDGWAEYLVHRKTFRYRKNPRLKGTLWNGEDLTGKAVLLLAEQGIGDTIQFVRYATAFKEKGADKVWIGCYESLIRLFSRLPSVDAVISLEDSFPSHDFYFFLPDSPALFGPDPETFPKNVPYMFPDPLLRKIEGDRMANLQGLKVGVVWAGNSQHPKDIFRSIDPVLLTDLLRTSDCSFVSLQKGGKSSFFSPFLTDRTEELVDFADTAALIASLDLVITVDTAVAHLAGAMGKSVWILLSKVPDWRWMLDRSDSPWYPTARLFRQETAGDWKSVLEAVQTALTEKSDAFFAAEFLRTAKRLYRSEDPACRKLREQSPFHQNVLEKATLLAEKESSSADEVTAVCRNFNMLVVVGDFLRASHRYEEAILLYKKGLALDPLHSGALLSLGTALAETGKYEEGLVYMDKALEANSGNAGARFARGFLYLLLGRYQEGWAEYRMHRKTEWSAKISGMRGSLWNGEDSLKGKTILLLSEQGAGDAIQFARYVRFFKEKGAKKVLLGCSDRLERVLARVSGVDAVVVEGTVPPFHDLHFYLMESPGFFGVNPEECNLKEPYIIVDPEWQTRWKERLSELPGYKVGLVWAGNPKHEKDKFRSMDPELLTSLIQTPGCSFVSLQKGKEGTFSSPFLIDWTEELIDFADTAALISHLDCVLTVDTAVAHLAGAMGKPVWILVPYVPDWRWLIDRSDSPWYSTARLFRQTKIKDWGDALLAVQEALVEAITPFSVEMPTKAARQLQEAFVAGSCEAACRKVLEENSLYREILNRWATASAQGNDPNDLCGLGDLLRLNLQNEEATILYKRCLVLDSRRSEVWRHLGIVLNETGLHREALECVEKAVQIDPHCLTARCIRGNLLLLSGRYEEGWPEFRLYRSLPQDRRLLGLRGALWNGEDLKGKSILLFVDQAFGDTIQFARYACLFKEKGAAQVLFACPAALIRVLSRVCGIDDVVRVGPVDSSQDWHLGAGFEPPSYDFHFFLPDAPIFFGTFPKELEGKNPYVVAEPRLKEYWSKRTAVLPGFKIGLVGIGSKEDRRSIDPSLWEGLLRTSGCSFVSLQKERSKDLNSSLVTDWTGDLLDFADTAALIASLDLVITIDTAVAHLAGAMGKKVWILLSYVADWRWQIEGADSPWYPTARLFRQKKQGDRESVLQEVQRELLRTIS